jgi:hypothetical protein
MYVMPVQAVAGCVAVNRRNARIANAAGSNRRARVFDGPPERPGWLVHMVDNVKRCRKVLALPALFCYMCQGYFPDSSTVPQRFTEKGGG